MTCSTGLGAESAEFSSAPPLSETVIAHSLALLQASLSPSLLSLPLSRPSPHPSQPCLQPRPTSSRVSCDFTLDHREPGTDSHQRIQAPLVDSGLATQRPCSPRRPASASSQALATRRTRRSCANSPTSTLNASMSLRGMSTTKTRSRRLRLNSRRTTLCANEGSTR